MANASKKHTGKGEQNKGSGSGAMTSESLADPLLGENQVLSNRDKAQHSDERGLDSRAIQNEQRQDNATNQQIPSEMELGNESGMSSPMSTGSGQDSNLDVSQGQSGALANPAPSEPGVEQRVRE
jgi:hypothetical protein